MTLQDITVSCREGIPLGKEQIDGSVAALLDAGVEAGDKLEFLRALTDKGETPDELAWFVGALLPHAVDPGFYGHWEGRRLFDCCGTGGGGFNLFNVSTGIMFILAACDVPVVKHGNRGVTKKSGSADVLAALGVPVAQSPSDLRRQVDSLGLAFIAAPVFHPAFKHLAPLRQKLAGEGRRTVFNLLGPLLNPCRPATQLVGVFKEPHLDLFSRALGALGRERHGVVYGEGPDGQALGEAGIFRRNALHWKLENGVVPYEESFRGAVPGLEGLMVESSAQSAEILEQLLRGEDVGCGSALLIHNAALALRIHGYGDFREAEQAAEEALVSGRAHAKLQAWRAWS
jgi:anthranilate phosphoribosyltransferase